MHSVPSAKLILQVDGRSLALDTTLRDDHNVISEHIGFVEKVCGKDHASPRPLCKDDIPDNAARERILFS
jgi:hypothetical protein